MTKELLFVCSLDITSCFCFMDTVVRGLKKLFFFFTLAWATKKMTRSILKWLGALAHGKYEVLRSCVGMRSLYVCGGILKDRKWRCFQWFYVIRGEHSQRRLRQEDDCSWVFWRDSGGEQEMPRVPFLCHHYPPCSWELNLTAELADWSWNVSPFMEIPD